MTEISIPKEALEAAARELTIVLVLAVDEDCRACALTDDERMEAARAACLAMLKAWPGMEHDPGALVAETYRDPGKIILPLPKENTND